MIYTEIVTIRGKQFRRTYSDTYTLTRDGEEFNEAVDPIDTDRTYVETDKLLEVEELSETEEKALAYDILTGVSE